MFGKWFAQTYTGSMFGAGPSVFAVWGYVVAHVQFETVEINPALLAAVLGDSPENIEKALHFLCAPDPASRTQIEQGRRLVREGQYLYRVPTARLYRSMRDEHDRRAYNRKKMAESRAKAKSQAVSTSETQVVCRRVPPCAGVCRCEPITENRPQTTDHRVQNKSNSEGSRANGCDVETATFEIAALYPKIRDPKNLSQEIQHAIAEAVARDGRDLVWAGTKSMAEAVARWPRSELKFIPAAGRFFRESQYKADPAEWERGEPGANQGNRGTPVEVPLSSISTEATPLDQNLKCDGCGTMGAMKMGKGKNACRDCVGRIKMR